MQSEVQHYFAKRYPFDALCALLTRFETPLENIEFAIEGADVYKRFVSVSSAEELRKKVVSHPDVRSLHIGATYDQPVKSGREAAKATILRHELVFDIDISDYEFVGSADDQDRIDRFWPVAASAAFVLTFLLRKAFAFDQIFVAYSGRRGCHVYALDETAQTLSAEARGAIVKYLNYAPSSDNLRVSDLTHSVATAHGLMPAMVYAFRDILIGESGFLDDIAERVDFVNALDVERHHAFGRLAEEVLTLNSGLETYDHVAAAVDRASKTKGGEWIQQKFEQVILAYTWPRLDANVTTSLGHLAKAPFVAHPKTGRIAVPVPVENLYHFKPASVVSIKNDALDVTHLNRAALYFERLFKNASSPSPWLEDVDAEDMEDAVSPPARAPRPVPRHIDRANRPRKRSPLVPKDLN